MTSLRNPILATIIYYDIFDYPLTLIEVYKYLINPGRIFKLAGGIEKVELSEVHVELDRLVKSQIIGQKNGFYFIGKRDGLSDLRIARQKIADQKWKKFLKMVRVLALAPYLRGVFASGSMAIGNTDEASDFDVLIIAKSGRLYTCRLFLWLISSIMGVRRKKDQKIAPNKLCFNHYITDASLFLPHESIFNAQMYINLKPAMISEDLIDRFYAANLWLNNYACNFQPQKYFSRRNTKAPGFLIFLARAVEFIFDFSIGNNLEKFLKSLQQKRIKNDPATYESGGRIIFNDNELEFHPRSFESVVIKKYNKDLRRFGVVMYVEEKDSGLMN